MALHGCHSRGRRSRALRALVVGGAAFVAVGTVTHAAADPVEPEYLHYVAMGDSFTNGAPIPPLDVTQDSALSCSPFEACLPLSVGASLIPMARSSCGTAMTAACRFNAAWPKPFRAPFDPPAGIKARLRDARKRQKRYKRVAGVCS